MLIAAESYDLTLEQQTQSITADTVAVATQRSMLRDKLKHEQILDRIRSIKAQRGPAALHVAQRVAKGEQPYLKPYHPEQVSRALRDMRNMGLIENPSRGYWRFTDPLLRRYLAELR